MAAVPTFKPATVAQAALAEGLIAELARRFPPGKPGTIEQVVEVTLDRFEQTTAGSILMQNGRQWDPNAIRARVGDLYAAFVVALRWILATELCDERMAALREQADAAFRAAGEQVLGRIEPG